MRSEDDAVARFDNSRLALVFALNAVDVEMPRPFMNRAMADTAVKVKKRGKKKKKVPERLFWNETEVMSAKELLDMELEHQRKPPRSRLAQAPLRGLDKAHQAGLILAQLATLGVEHVTVLKGLLIRAYDPCACRSPCCSGRRRNARWAEAVKATCELLKGTGDAMRESGKRGLSTQPEMRLALVEQFYTKNTMTVAAAAHIGKVSTMTATRHRDWIFAWLEQTETEAWLRVDTLFDQLGITGPAA